MFLKSASRDHLWRKACWLQVFFKACLKKDMLNSLNLLKHPPLQKCQRNQYFIIQNKIILNTVFQNSFFFSVYDYLPSIHYIHSFLTLHHSCSQVLALSVTQCFTQVTLKKDITIRGYKYPFVINNS